MGFELSEKRAEIPSASSLGPTFGPLRAIGSGTTIWSEGARALPLQWSLPRPRKPRPSPEEGEVSFSHLRPQQQADRVLRPGTPEPRRRDRRPSPGLRDPNGAREPSSTLLVSATRVPGGVE